MTQDICPFFPVSVMALSTYNKPDDDPVLQTFLLSDRIQRDLLGINKPAGEVARLVVDIRQLAKYGLELCKFIVQLYNFRVITMLHRVMRHLEECLLDCGYSQWDSTDANETIHKFSKQGYRATNNHLDTLATQFLVSRVQIAATEKRTL